MITGEDYRVHTADGMGLVLRRLQAASPAAAGVRAGSQRGHSAGGIAGAADRLLAPPAAVRDLLDRFTAAERELIVAGRAAGFSRDHDHPGLMIGRAAREEIWPRILQWLHQQERRISEP